MKIINRDLVFTLLSGIGILVAVSLYLSGKEINNDEIPFVYEFLAVVGALMVIIPGIVLYSSSQRYFAEKLIQWKNSKIIVVFFAFTIIIVLSQAIIKSTFGIIHIIALLCLGIPLCLFVRKKA